MTVRVLALAVVAALAVAGCLGDGARPSSKARPQPVGEEAEPEPGEEPADEPSSATSSTSSGRRPAPKHTTSTTSSGAKPSQAPPQENSTAPSGGPPWPEPHDYTQSVWFNWGKKELNVLVLGVKDPIVGAAIQRGIASWENGLAVMAPDLGVTLKVHWAPDGAPPTLAPDILFVPQGFFATHPTPVARCVATAPLLVGTSSAVHTAAHEFGHCLGLSHVFERGDEYAPEEDIMGAGIPGQIACPSNLNVAILRMAFGGETGELGMPSGYYRQATSC